MQCRAQRWAQVALAVLVVSMIGVHVARADAIAVCPVESVDVSCPGQSEADDSTVTTEAVYACVGYAVVVGSGWSACGPGEGYQGAWVFNGSLPAGSYVWYMDGYRAIEDAPFYSGGSPPAADSWVPELSNEQATKLWGAALMLFVLAFVGRILRQAIKKG